MKAIILAGGGGTRLFPLSRKSMPKQFLSIDQEGSLLEETIRRCQKLMKPEDLLLVTNQRYMHHVQNELESGGMEGAGLVLEPVARNTAPAIALAAKYAMEKLGAGPEEALFVSTSDHIIKPAEAFRDSVKLAARQAEKGKFVTFGVHPDYPETGFGYIELGEEQDGVFVTSSFKEKPDRETAEKYLQQGNYLWNSGMFAFRLGEFWEEIKKNAPGIYELSQGTYEEMLASFSDMPEISIDYAVAEHMTDGVTVPLKCYWNDVGSWDAIYDVLEKDGDGNAIRGDVLPIDSKRNLIYGRSRLISTIGIEDCLVIETDDVILVASRGQSQKVKELVTDLKQMGRKEAEEHTTLYYEWGRSSLLGSGNGYQMKKLVIRPGGAIRERMHYHRSVHWIVTKGTARVYIDGQPKMVHSNESVYIPQTVPYSIMNPGRIPLVIIQVENGDYLKDDDCVCMEGQHG